MLYRHHPDDCEGCLALARLRAGDTRHRTIARAALEPAILLGAAALALTGFIAYVLLVGAAPA